MIETGRFTTGTYRGRGNAAPIPPLASGGATLHGRGEVAQLVEHTAENRGVAGSSPALAMTEACAPARCWLGVMRERDARTQGPYMGHIGATDDEAARPQVPS